MLSRKLITIVGTLLILSFCAGRYLAPQSVTSTEKTVEAQTEEQVNKNVQRHTTTVKVERPNGEINTTITTDVVSNTEAIKKEESVSKEAVNYKTATTNVSLIVATESPYTRLTPFTYGISVNHEIAGPITLGAFFLADKTLGITVGVNF